MKNARNFVFKFSIALVLLFGIVGCDGCTSPLPEEEIITAKELDSIIISPEKAKVRFENYGRHRGKIIKIYEDNGRKLDNGTVQNQQYEKGQSHLKKTKSQIEERGFVPVEYIDYDFDDLKKYMKFIEQQTAEAGYDISTMRVYFANYPANDPVKDKQKRNTVMFVPTINVNGAESAYYLSNEGPEGKFRPYILSDSLVDTEKPAPNGKSGKQNDSNKASLLPNMINSNLPTPFYARQSVIGNEGGRNPPSHN